MKVLTGIAAAIFTILTTSAVVATIYPAGFDPNNACVSNTRQITAGLGMYTQDFDERLPVMDNSADFQTELTPFVQNPKVFICPATGAGYMPNSLIGLETLAQIGDSHATETFQDTQAHSDKLKTVAFMDGHIERGGITQGDPNERCISNIRQLSLAMDLYTQDYDEHFPPMNKQSDYQTALLPYVGDSSYFICPVTSDIYMGNISLSGKLVGFGNPESVATVADSAAHPDGAVSIGYLDGHVSNNDVLPPNTCYGNMTALGNAVTEYAYANNGHLPPTDTEADFVNALAPYASSPNIFKCPDTGLPYALNPAVSGQLMSAANQVVAQDPVLNNDGTENSLNVYPWAALHETTAYYFVPSGLSTDPAGNAALIWQRPTDKLPPSATSVGITDLSSNGSLTDQLNYPAPPISSTGGRVLTGVTSVNGDSRLLSWTASSEAPYLLGIPGYPSSSNLSSYPLDIDITNSGGAISASAADGPYDGWQPIFVANGGSAQSRLLMQRYTGALALWDVAADGTYADSMSLTLAKGQAPIGLATGSDGNTYLLLSVRGGYQIWTISSTNAITRQMSYETLDNHSSIVHMSVGPDKLVRLLVNEGDGKAEVWKLDAMGNLKAITTVVEGSSFVPKQVGVDQGGNNLVLWTSPGGVGIVTRVALSGKILYTENYAPHL